MTAQTFVMFFDLIGVEAPAPSNWIYALITLTVSGFMFGGTLMTGPAVRSRFNRQVEAGA